MLDTDFYLQTFFFLTVLSMDINRTKMVDLVQKQNLRTFRLSDSRSGEKMDLSGLSSSSKGSLMSAINSKISAENISSIFSAHPASDGIKSLSKLQHKDTDYWRRLPYSHWPMLFGLYNSEDIMEEIDSVTRNVALMEDMMEQTSGAPPVAQAIKLPCVAHKVCYNC